MRLEQNHKSSYSIKKSNSCCAETLSLWLRNLGHIFVVQTQNLLTKCKKNAAVLWGSCTCAMFASCQARNADLQSVWAVQMWNQRASVIVYPLVCKFTVSSLRPLLSTRLLAFHAVYLTSAPSLPCTSGRSCSIPAGPCLFISSEVVMINEALNTSCISPGPREPNSWVNRPSLCASVLSRAGSAKGSPPVQVTSHELPSKLCLFGWTSTYYLAFRDPTETYLVVRESEPPVNSHSLPENLAMCGACAHKRWPYGQAVHERNLFVQNSAGRGSRFITFLLVLSTEGSDSFCGFSDLLRRQPIIEKYTY